MIFGNPLVTQVPDSVTLTVYTVILITKAMTSQEKREYFCLINDGKRICHQVLKKKFLPEQIGQHTPGFLIGFTQDIEHTCCVHTFWPMLH